MFKLIENDMANKVKFERENVVRVASQLFWQKGFHATSVVGVFSSAFIYGYLNEYSKEEIVNSLGIAGSFCSGNLSFLKNGDNTKIVHPGWASFSGCSAAELVNLGITGSSNIFEDKNGIYNVYHSYQTKPFYEN
jgi:2-methylcitrate dehydratase PrpD